MHSLHIVTIVCIYLMHSAALYIGTYLLSVSDYYALALLSNYNIASWK